MNAKYALETLPSLSFSRYLRLKKCQLSGAVLGRATPLRSLRPPRLRAQVLGDILHEVMSGINRLSGAPLSQAAFRGRFNAVVRETHAKIAAAPASRHLGDPNSWPELVAVYRRLAEVVEMRRAGDEGVVTYAERKLSSRDGLLWGQVDAYFLSKTGIDLVDYKSGTIFEGDAPKQDYEDQLYFYAYLIHETHALYPSSLGLIGRGGGKVLLPPSADRSAAIASDMRALLTQYNHAVAQSAPLENLANPASESCVFCDRKAICDRFWVSLTLLDIPPWNHVAVGRQATPLVRTSHGGGWFELEVERSSISAQFIKVTRVFEQRFPAVDLGCRVGQRLMLTGLRASRTTNAAVAEATDRSTLVCLGSPLERS